MRDGDAGGTGMGTEEGQRWDGGALRAAGGAPMRWECIQGSDGEAGGAAVGTEEGKRWDGGALRAVMGISDWNYVGSCFYQISEG